MGQFTSINLYDKPQRTPQAAAEVVQVVVSAPGGPGTAAATVIVFYTIPAA